MTNNKPIELRRETKEACPSVVSLTTLFLHSLTPVHSVSSLVCCCTGVRLERKCLDFNSKCMFDAHYTVIVRWWFDVHNVHVNLYIKFVHCKFVH